MNLKEIIKNEYDLNGAILGTLMGDATITRPISKKTGLPCGNGKFAITHGAEQKEYLEFKEKILQINPLVTTKIISRETYLKKTNKTYLEYYCYSNANQYATSIYDLVYDKGVKRVNENILSLLTDFGLFLWYLDDGYLNIRRYKDSDKIKEYRMFLYTMNFTLDEVKIIKNWFEKKYNISPNINKKQNGYILYFNGNKTRKFMEIIEPFYNIVPCLNRKFLKEYFN